MNNQKEMPDDKNQSLASQEANSGRKGFLRAMLYASLLIAMLFAALEAHEYISARRNVPSRPFSPNLSTGRNPAFSATRPTVAASMPIDPLTGPKGICAIDADPGDIAPPDDAERTSSIEIPSAHEISQQASYTFFGNADEVVEHYKEAIEAAGYKFNSDQDRGDARVLIFMQGTNRAVLFLRENTGRTSIELTVTRSIGRN